MKNKLILCISVLVLLFNTTMLELTKAQDNATSPPKLLQDKKYGDVKIILPEDTHEVEGTMDSAEEQAIADAKRDAKAHMNKQIWFSVGCFLPVVGPIYSQGKIKTIPLARTLGKSPEYIAFYTDNYRLEMKKQRFKWAFGGCLVGGLADACLIGILINRYVID